MSLKTVATRLVALCNQRKHFDVMRTMYAPEIVSVEADGAQTVGQGPVIKSSETFQSSNPIQSQKIRGPFLHGPDRFAVHFTFEVVPTRTGKPATIEEVGVYTVGRDDKITRQEFFDDREH